MRHVVNASTRSVSMVEFTAQEAAARTAESAAWILARNTRSQNDGITEARIAARLAVANRIIDAELAKPRSDLPEIETLRTALGR